MAKAKKTVKGAKIYREDYTNTDNNNVVVEWSAPSVGSKDYSVSGYTVQLTYKTATVDKYVLASESTVGTNQVDNKKKFRISLTAPASSTRIAVRVKPNPGSKTTSRTSAWSGSFVYAKNGTASSIISPWLENQRAKANAEATSLADKIAKPATPSMSSATYVAVSNSIRIQFSNSATNSDKTYVREYINDAPADGSYTDVAIVDRSATEYVRTGVAAGTRYRYSALAHNKFEGQIGGTVAWSDMSTFTEWIDAPPITPTKLEAKSTGNMAVNLSWEDSGNTGDRYEIAYSDDLNEIKNSPQAQSVQRISISDAYPINGRYSYPIHISDGGKQWHFRVRRGSDGGWSGWSGVKSAIIGRIPDAPTTYATPPYVSGQTVSLRWAYTNTDGSEQQAAQIRLTGAINTTIDVSGSSQHYDLNISNVTNGATVSWSVRCKGVVDGYGDYSSVKSFAVVLPPTLTVGDSSTNGSVVSYPIAITATSDVSSRPVSYFAQISCTEDVETTQPDGSTKVLREGTVMWSKQVVTTSTSATFSISPTDISLEDGETYELSVTVANAYGLRTNVKRNLMFFATDSDVAIFANAEFDDDGLFAVVYPACYDLVIEDDEVQYDDDGALLLGDLSDRVLSVWRMDAYGNWELIADGIQNSGTVCVTDPYPTLGECVYRVCAVDNTSGDFDYSDESIECDVDAIIIDMDGKWERVSNDENDPDSVVRFTSDRVILPTNIEVSESSDPDSVELELWGDDAPTLRNGTHLRIGGSWSCSFYKKDNDDVIAGLRRLMSHVGSVYVREPGGVGYWAKCRVNISRAYDSLGVNASLDVTRVKSPNSGDGTVS